MVAKSSGYRNRLYEVTEEHIDQNTGEMKRWVKKFSVKTKAENFYLTYIDNLSGYFCLTSNTDKSVLAYLCAGAEYDTGRVSLNPEERKEACVLLGICVQQFSNSICKLKELRLLSGRNGFYMINPAIFWKGNSKTRSSLLMDNQLAVEFNFEIEEEPTMVPDPSFNKEANE
jgi:hypothetical protein